MPPSKGPAVVVKVITRDRVILNQGVRDGVRLNQRFLIYEIGEPLTDPVTGEDLGFLELSKGVGRIVQVQEKVAILFNELNYFNGPEVGDLVKPI